MGDTEAYCSISRLLLSCVAPLCFFTVAAVFPLNALKVWVPLPIECWLEITTWHSSAAHCHSGVILVLFSFPNLEAAEEGTLVVVVAKDHFLVSWELHSREMQVKSFGAVSLGWRVYAVGQSYGFLSTDKSQG